MRAARVDAALTELIDHFADEDYGYRRVFTRLWRYYPDSLCDLQDPPVVLRVSGPAVLRSTSRRARFAGSEFAGLSLSSPEVTLPYIERVLMYLTKLKQLELLGDPHWYEDLWSEEGSALAALPSTLEGFALRWSRETHPTARSLRLSSSLMVWLSVNQTLKRLSLDFVRLQTNEWRGLIHVAKHHPALTYLSLRRNAFDPSFGYHLGELIARSPGLRILELGGNHLEHGIVDIGKVLGTKTTRLEKLGLAENRLRDVHVHDWVGEVLQARLFLLTRPSFHFLPGKSKTEDFPRCGLVSLDLSMNRLGMAALNDLSWLCHAPVFYPRPVCRLRALKLSRSSEIATHRKLSYMSPDPPPFFEQALVSSNCSLEVLDLGEPPSWSTALRPTLGDGLRGNRSLKRLDLTNGLLFNASAEASLLIMLEETRVLEGLILNESRFVFNGGFVDRLAALLETHASLRELRLVKCYSGLSSCAAMLRAVSVNSVLEALDLSGNHVGDLGIKFLLVPAMASGSLGLKELLLRDCDVSDESLVELADGLPGAVALRRLTVEAHFCRLGQVALGKTLKRLTYPLQLELNADHIELERGRSRNRANLAMAALCLGHDGRASAPGLLNDAPGRDGNDVLKREIFQLLLELEKASLEAAFG